ncbi:hypothetical protein [Henriciella marina]|uniref:Uncharacterized protein n=1 Tax=Henriciella marina TaxID=453851 RepID=A0ABT4LSL0_9PROT|nr:hypothetical protein [Henriciella marina]MCZ4297345.1 hypothetical protein [Henriciella marina]
MPAALVSFALHSRPAIAIHEPSRFAENLPGSFRLASASREPSPPGRSGPPCLVMGCVDYGSGSWGWGRIGFVAQMTPFGVIPVFAKRNTGT